jgi:chemotaxis protein MotB
MRRGRRKRRHVNHDRWLVSYADFITLLFAFFVVLYASSQFDKTKIEKVSAAIEGAFQDLGAFPVETAKANSVSPPPVNPSLSSSPKLPPKPGLVPVDLSQADGGGFGPDLSKLKRDLEQTLGEEIEKHEIEMRVTPEGLVISLHEVGFFKSGDAILIPDGQNTLARIAGILNDKGFQIRVEGHTDNIPIHTGRYKSNWELSVARATEVVSLLIEKYGFDPQGISAAGFSEYHPITSNATEEGRKANRRVDLVVVARSMRASDSPAPSAGR